MRVLLALSGGIDSSVVAHVLREQRHDVVGVRFLLWNDPTAPALAQILPSKCCDAQSAARAQTVANALKIPLHIIDISEEFKHIVVDQYLADERSGKTPNPCVLCNREIKFGRLLAIADELGCEKVASGHYARTEERDGSMRLLEAIDAKKDQSYYLHGLSQAQLRRAIFPLGELSKPQVFSLASTYGIPFNEHYRESMDLCFFPEKTPEAFLRRQIPDALRSGPIAKRDGTVVGTHEGLPLYTVGQRRGLKIGGLKIPLEVVAKDGAHNTLIVAEHDTERVREIVSSDFHWIADIPATDERLECRTRSLSKKQSGTVRREGDTVRFLCQEPQPPPSPGQYLVIYRGQEVLGGGEIC